MREQVVKKTSKAGSILPRGSEKERNPCRSRRDLEDEFEYISIEPKKRIGWILSIVSGSAIELDFDWIYASLGFAEVKRTGQFFPGILKLVLEFDFT
ncbi:hypothetical protein NDU88_007082 [Pleurodeles waltl]|uniref:Uncharacterized protein n=1 Tax=Pleurodeles waltl TaxID=8319 RepID=A0AAV7RS46_PLEWA|nr:hypothetical protein NDU88_007082 [Pleurodeles waltl]